MPTEEQVADVLTKPFSMGRFEFLREKLRVKNSPFRLKEGVESNSQS